MKQLELFSIDPPPAPRATEARPTDARRREPAPRSLEAPRAPSPARELEERLAPLLDRPIHSVTLTNNRARIFSARPEGRGLVLRIHRSFAGAPEPVLRAVADYLGAERGSPTRRRALGILRQHFEHHRPPDKAPRAPRPRPVGHRFDLRALRDEINREYFDDRLEVEITWGRAPRRRRRGRRGVSIRLGSYNHHQNLVRIHPALDRPGVPRYVVASVVHHEMLHAALPPRMKNGRRQLHPPEFRRRERLFRDHRAAEEWLDQNLHQLTGCT
jgi:predicted metal-dependent hydrolase